MDLKPQNFLATAAGDITTTVQEVKHGCGSRTDNTVFAIKYPI